MMISNVLRLSLGSNLTLDCTLELTCDNPPCSYQWCLYDGNDFQDYLYGELLLPGKYAKSVFTKRNETELHFRGVTSKLNASLVYCSLTPCNEFQSGLSHIHAVVILSELPVPTGKS